MVPWISTPEALSASARVPSGLLGPGRDHLRHALGPVAAGVVPGRHELLVHDLPVAERRGVLGRADGTLVLLLDLGAVVERPGSSFERLTMIVWPRSSSVTFGFSVLTVTSTLRSPSENTLSAEKAAAMAFSAPATSSLLAVLGVRDHELPGLAGDRRVFGASRRSPCASSEGSLHRCGVDGVARSDLRRKDAVGEVGPEPGNERSGPPRGHRLVEHRLGVDGDGTGGIEREGLYRLRPPRQGA